MSDSFLEDEFLELEEVSESEFEEVVETFIEIDHSKEEGLVTVGAITSCGYTVTAIIDENRVLISNRTTAKVVNKSDIEIV